MCTTTTTITSWYLVMKTRSQTRVLRADTNTTTTMKTRSRYQTIRNNPETDPSFHEKVSHIRKLMCDNDTMIGRRSRIRSIFEMFDYLLHIKEDLYMLGPKFNQVIMIKLNEFIEADEDMDSFSERMHDEYKTQLLPYITWNSVSTTYHKPRNPFPKC